MHNIIEYKNFIWVDITEPTEEDVRYLQKNFKLHSLTLKTIIPPIHHPDLDIFKKYISIILHYPNLEKNGEMRIQELDLILGENYLITNHHRKISFLNQIFDDCLNSEVKRMEYMERGPAFLLFTTLNRFLKEKLAKIDQIEEKIEKLEEKIFLEEEKEIIKEISELKRKIIDFWRVVAPQRMIFESLRNVVEKFYSHEFGHYFSVLFRIHRRIEDALNASKETIESLEETNHIIITSKINNVIKILTIFSVILLPLTLLASIWGMNIPEMPLTSSSLGFWTVLALMAVLMGFMITFFRRKKWL